MSHPSYNLVTLLYNCCLLQELLSGCQAHCHSVCTCMCTYVHVCMYVCMYLQCMHVHYCTIWHVICYITAMLLKWVFTMLYGCSLAYGPDLCYYDESSIIFIAFPSGFHTQTTMSEYGDNKNGQSLTLGSAHSS